MSRVSCEKSMHSMHAPHPREKQENQYHDICGTDAASKLRGGGCERVGHGSIGVSAEKASLLDLRGFYCGEPQAYTSGRGSSVRGLPMFARKRMAGFYRFRAIGAVLIALFSLTVKAGQNFEVYVSNEKSGDVTVINGSDNRVLATIPVGKRPRGIHAGP